ncbi:MAG: Ig-like domain-containing protein [Pseudomonadota bacterium]
MSFQTLSSDWLLGGVTMRVPTGPAQVNQPPVALADVAAALQGQTVSIDVLANDSDPEGGLLTVVSADANEGTVVIAPDNTLSYSAPLSFAGQDLISYTISDPAGLTSNGEVRVDVSEVALAANMEPDGTISLDAANGELAITVLTPAAYAGTYMVNTTDLDGGPVALVPPALSGSGGVGETLSAQSGLWVYEAVDGTPDKTFQWTRDGVDILGQTGSTYVVSSTDTGTAISVREAASNTAGARTASANASIAIPV